MHFVVTAAVKRFSPVPAEFESYGLFCNNMWIEDLTKLIKQFEDSCLLGRDTLLSKQLLTVQWTVSPPSVSVQWL